jgi:allantoate deiminase
MITGAGRNLMQRLSDFARHSDEPDAMTRIFLSPAHRRAVDDLMGQLRGLGLSPWLDGIGNVQARYAGTDPGAPAILIGSHIDTVRNAGIYDGNLGVFAALGAIEALIENGERLRCPIDFVAFGDEEGVRFPTSLAGSRALVGGFDLTNLDIQDEDGISLKQALLNFGCDPGAIPGLARPPASVAAFLEMHIEQGPVLEAADLPLGIVTAISGASRFNVALTGLAGHAGTVPMELRRDALAAAAEMILGIESLAKAEPDLVATIGRIDARPGAVNVIPGKVHFTLDIRAPQDLVREQGVEAALALLRSVAESRSIRIEILRAHDASAVQCAPLVQEALASALNGSRIPPLRLASGAGHDAMAIAPLCPVGMLFVRCKGGISHNPLESITLEDASIALEVFKAAIKQLAA